MPGRIFVTMSSSGANGAESGIHSKSNGSNGASIAAAGKSTEQQQNDRGHEYAVMNSGVNGSHATHINGLPKDIYPRSKPQPLVNGITNVDPMDSDNTLFNLPAEVFEIMENEYLPFSRLVNRISQQAFVDLSDLVGSLASLPLPQPGINGSAHSLFNGPSHAPNKANDNKKLSLLAWANSNREKFIKLMVLSDWAHANNETTIPLWKLMVWANNQDGLTAQVLAAFPIAKAGFFGLKLNQPDIPTALEVLATGNDSRMPDVRLA
jgi:mediator of RNA polymerase II transcription subunit 14